MTPEQFSFLYWIAGTVAASWLLPKPAASTAISLACALYVAVYAPISLMGLALVTCVVGLALITGKGRPGWVLAAVAICCVLFVAYRAWPAMAGNGEVLGVLGFAFYVLRAVHVLLEGYTGRPPAPGWRELIGYLWFLPTLHVGPIHRYQPFQRDLFRRRWDSELFAQGIARMLWGYAKVVIAANYLVSDKYAGWVGALDRTGWWYHYLDTLQYGINLYFKFAGYSDIAIGFALLIGFRVMENFRFPFLARDISDFWRRWHISLSSWCKEYVYMPVFSVTRIPAVAAIATMLVLGLWHELSLRYLLWGVWHGLGIAVCQRWQRSAAAASINSGIAGKIWNPVAGFITLNFVILSFVLTGTDSLEAMLQRWRVLLFLGP